jgi:hypothetical protein
MSFISPNLNKTAKNRLYSSPVFRITDILISKCVAVQLAGDEGRYLIF